MRSISLTETDRRIYEKELMPYLPSRLFDIHAHTLLNRFYVNLGLLNPLAEQQMLRDVDVRWLESWWHSLFPGKKVNGLILGFPARGCDIDGINEHLRTDVMPPNRFSILVHPRTSADTLDKQVRMLKPTGLKPYMVFADKTDYEEVGITDMITPEQIKVASQHRLCLTLHLSKARGLADAENLREVRRLVHDYPNCNFILAHCGRCFLSRLMAEALDSLPVTENLWLDTSAVCDLGVFIELFKRYDPSRIVFGTDLVTATGFRGKYVTMGFSWGVCEEAALRAAGAPPKEATFAVYENLRVLLEASRVCQLSESDVENMFYNNAARLLSLKDIDNDAGETY
jgi:hypothetical protein